MSIIEEEKEGYFDDQLDSFKNAINPSLRSASSSLNLQDYWVEDHNFFNGVSPTAAVNYAPITL